VHIEQGPILELENLPVGVVTAINGMTKAKATISGVAGHAGTVPMGRRTDALVAFADVVAAVSRMAAEFPDAVATIGSVDVQPGASNVIPGKVVFTLDIRAPDNRVRADLVAAISRVIDAVCQRHGASNAVEIVAENPATPMDAGLAGKLGEAVVAEGIALRTLPSGAGHDAISMAAVTPVAMLFVRCLKGISHNPAEDVDPIDAARAVRVLYRAVRDLASDSSRPVR
jgi:allantoate deiminase